MAELALFITCIVLVLVIIIQSELHRRQLNDLLNRFMARNLTEYQTGKEKAPVKRSESGNFIFDGLAKVQKSNSLDE